MRLRLRTVLIGLNLIVLVLPLASIQVLRLYESALVRQTESELIAQGAFIAAAYRSAFDRILAHTRPAATGAPSALERHSAPLPGAALEQASTRYRTPELDLVDSPLLPPQPPSQPLAPGRRADSLAYIVGQDLESILRDAQRVTLAAIRLVDYQGVVVATTGADRYTDLRATEEVALALTGIPAARLREKEDVVESPLNSISRTSRIRAFVATPIVFEGRVLGVVLLSRTPANILQALYAKRLLLVQAAVLLLVIVVLIAFVTSTTIVRPMRTISTLARRVAAGDGDAIDAIAIGGTAEIAELGEQIANMGRSLDHRRRYVQEFARHVSHEFKTPLTGLRGALEVLEDHGADMRADERAQFLSNMAGDVQHLHRLTERLLQLARADTIEAPGDAETDLAALLDSLRASYPMLVLGPGLDRNCRVGADGEAVEAALTQLLDNALIHGGHTSRIEINRAGAAAEARTGELALWITDNGAGISPGNRERVMQPFFTTARGNGGTGLGLAIAQRLLESQGGSLRLVDATNGCTFEVRLALSETR